MKAAAFDYLRPTSLRELCRLLAVAGDVGAANHESRRNDEARTP